MRKSTTPLTDTQAVTMADVAQLAGVNIATVSRTLHRPDLVKGSTKNRVEQAIEQLHYVPNPSARALASKRTGAIAYFIRSADMITASAFAPFIRDIEQALQTRGENLLMVACTSSDDLVQKCNALMADAFIFHSILITEDIVKAVRRRNLPVVFMDCRKEEQLSSTGGLLHTILMDKKRNAFNLTQHLLAKGCQRIAYLDPAQKLDDSGPFMGYLEALRESGTLHNPRLAMPIGQQVPIREELYERGRMACRELLAMGPDSFDGIIAGGDINTLGVINELRVQGLRIPEDVAVCSLNDSFLCLCSTPTITAGFFDPRAVSQAVMEHLGNNNESSARENLLIVQPTLIERASSSRA